MRAASSRLALAAGLAAILGLAACGPGEEGEGGGEDRAESSDRGDGAEEDDD